ncbi:MAG: hypothetical protein ACKV0T_13630 [Planctomycetales bacterium]
MIHDLHTFTLHGIWSELDPELKLFHTVFVPTQDITATVGLSLLTFGAKQIGDRREMGWAGGVIKKGAFADSQNRAQNISVGSDWNRNGLRINRCVFVTYQLSVAFGEAVAQCNLFFHEPSAVRAVKPPATRHAILYDKKSKAAVSVHSLTTFQGARVVSDRLLTREIRKCGAVDLNRPERSLGVHFHESGDFHFSQGLRVDVRSGKLVASRPVDPGRAV